MGESYNREGAGVARILHGGIHSLITEKGPGRQDNAWKNSQPYNREGDGGARIMCRGIHSLITEKGTGAPG